MNDFEKSFLVEGKAQLCDYIKDLHTYTVKSIALKSLITDAPEAAWSVDAGSISGAATIPNQALVDI